MNKLRAQEMMESGEMKHVTYNGERIYIQHVDPKNNTARIYPLDDPGKEMEVPLSQLVEHH